MMEKPEERDNNLICCLICGAFGFIFNFIAFVSPYWIVGKEGIQKEFVRIGLWQSCFSDYVHPEDYVSKKYSGCWYIYWPEYDYIRDWLNPPWFYAVQMMAILSFICNMTAFAIPLLKFTGSLDLKEIKSNVAAMFIEFIAVGADVIVIIIMGVMSKDRNWLPRPDQNYLSWSFGFAVVGTFFKLFCLFNLYIHYIIYNLAPGYKRIAKLYNEIPFNNFADDTLNKSHVGSVSGMHSGRPGGSNIYSQGGRSIAGTTSGATASAKAREAMLQKQKNPYDGSASSLNFLGQMKNNAGSGNNLADMGREPVMNGRGSMSSLHSNSRLQHNRNPSTGGSII